MIKIPVVIIGAGPAGVAAAIQLKRYGVDFMIFEKGEIGGLLKNANYIENYIGFPQGIGGKQMVKLIARHLKSLGIAVLTEEVISIDFVDGSFSIQSDNNQYLSEYLIIASGTRAVTDDKVSIDVRAKERIYYEIADIDTENLNHAAIIGSGDAAYDYALNLSTKGVTSTMYMRGKDSNALPLLLERAKSDERIKIVGKHSLTEVNRKDNLDLCFNTDDGIKNYEADCLLFAIGREPELCYLSDSLLNIRKRLTEEEKLIFAGDVKNKIYRQASISSGDGIFAAMKIYRKLNQ